MAPQHGHAQLSLRSSVPSQPNRQKWDKGQERRCKPGASSGPGEGHSRSASHQWVGGGLASPVTTWWRADPMGAEPPAHEGRRNIPAPEGARCRGQALLSPVCRPATEFLTRVRPRGYPRHSGSKCLLQNRPPAMEGSPESHGPVPRQGTSGVPLISDLIRVVRRLPGSQETHITERKSSLPTEDGTTAEGTESLRDGAGSMQSLGPPVPSGLGVTRARRPTHLTDGAGQSGETGTGCDAQDSGTGPQTRLCT